MQKVETVEKLKSETSYKVMIYTLKSAKSNMLFNMVELLSAIYFSKCTLKHTVTFAEVYFSMAISSNI